MFVVPVAYFGTLLLRTLFGRAPVAGSNPAASRTHSAIGRADSEPRQTAKLLGSSLPPASAPVQVLNADAEWLRMNGERVPATAAPALSKGARKRRAKAVAKAAAGKVEP